MLTRLTILSCTVAPLMLWAACPSQPKKAPKPATKTAVAKKPEPEEKTAVPREKGPALVLMAGGNVIFDGQLVCPVSKVLALPGRTFNVQPLLNALKKRASGRKLRVCVDDNVPFIAALKVLHSADPVALGRMKGSFKGAAQHGWDDCKQLALSPAMGDAELMVGVLTGGYFLGLDDSQERVSDLAALETRLKKRTPGPTLVAVEDEVPFGRVSQVIAALRARGFKQVQISTDEGTHGFPGDEERGGGLLKPASKAQLDQIYGKEGAKGIGDAIADAYDRKGTSAPPPGMGTLGTLGGGRRRVGKRVGPRLRFAQTRVKGPLSKEVVRRIIRRHGNELKYCSDLGGPKAQGYLDIKFTIAPSGRVTDATLKASTVKDKKVKGCLESAYRRWLFPKPKGGHPVTVEQRVELSPAK